MTHAEETQGLPSCSGLERLALCAGSGNAERGLPDSPSDDSTFGDRVHAALAGTLCTTDHEINECADACARLLNATTLELYGAALPDNTWTEQRLWFSRNGSVVFSGKADLIMRFGSRWFVADYKTGRNDTTAANRNWQLRGLAVLVRQAAESMGEPVSDITVAIIAPWQSERVTLCRYTPDDLPLAEAVVLRVIDAAQKPDAPRTPSEDACHYCKAKLTCPESRAQVTAVAAVPTTALTPHQLALFLDLCGPAERVIDAAREEAKRLLAAGVLLPGWRLKDGVVREKVTDVQTVFARLNQRHGVTVERFTKSCSITKKELDGPLREAAGLKGRAVAVEIEAITEGCVESKKAAASLERVSV